MLILSDCIEPYKLIVYRDKENQLELVKTIVFFVISIKRRGGKTADSAPATPPL